MSKFPDVINIYVYDNNTKRAISNIAIKIKLFASYKNDYSFILPLSNEMGHIRVTRDWLIGEIEKEQALFTMDYSSKLDDCKLEIELSILGTEDIVRLTNAMQLFQNVTGISDKEIDKYKHTDNLKYLPCVKKINLEEIIDLNISISLCAI